MRALRILHVTPYSPAAWAYGGIPRLAGTLTRGLARRGHHVTMCATDGCDESARLPRNHARASRFGDWPSTRIDDGVTLRVFPNISNSLAYHLQLFLPLHFERYMRRHAGDFDVAHLHACRNGIGAIAAHHLKRAGVPYVLAPNGTAPRIERRRAIKRAYDLVLGQRIIDDAARVLAVSHAERRQLHDLGVRPDVIRFIPNPIDLEEFIEPIARGRFRRRTGLISQRFVLFLGKLTPRKRLDVLARAVAGLRDSDVWLVIAGNDMGAGAALGSLVRSLGLESRTLFTGLLRSRDRLEALADADVVVYPSQDEIFGLVPLEALLAGTPVIVADDSGCGEVIRASGGGQIVPLGDVEALSAAIGDALNNTTRWREAAEGAAGRVRAAYGPDVVCPQVDRMYGEIVGAA
jgi:glycosyltransferase involved in cell wall biosynthesis